MNGLRIVVIGAGSHIFGAAHAPALVAVDAEVVGLQDVNTSLAQRVGDERGWPVYDDLDALLAVPADAAVITASHPAHAELSLACLRAGLHVLVEKPLAVSVDEADEVVAEGEARSLVVAVALQHRLRREVQAAKRAIDEGRLGELHRAEVVSYYPKRALYYTTVPWRGTWAGAAGGIVMNQGQHDLDLLAYLAGAPARLCGVARTRLQPTETEDTAEAVVEWADRATGSIHISSAAQNGTQRIELVGSRGVLRILPGELHIVENEVDMREFGRAAGGLWDPLPTRALPVFAGGGGTHEEIYRDFAEALRDGRPPVAPAADAATALELTNAITLSSHTGQWVELPLDRAAYRDVLDGLRELQVS
jgi:predicted dehydrogenase